MSQALRAGVTPRFRPAPGRKGMWRIEQGVSSPSLPAAAWIAVAVAAVLGACCAIAAGGATFLRTRAGSMASERTTEERDTR